MRPLAVALAVCTLALAGCGGEQEEAAPPTTTETAPVIAPEATIAGTGLDGEPVSIADYRGRPVLVNVWSSW
jgi:hypothetical protein